MAAEMLGSAVVQETVSGALSYLSNNREEKASERHNLERLAMAHTELGFAVELSSKMPIKDVSLLRRSSMLKRAFEECGEAVERCKRRVLEADEEEQRRVTQSSSFPKRFSHAVKSYASAFLGMNKSDLLSRSNVQRFEWFGVKAREFARDVETGCTLAHYNFFSPLIRPLLEEKKPLHYKMLQESQFFHISIVPVSLQGHGVQASILLGKDDIRMPLRSFQLYMLLQLSESTDIFGTIIRCLQLLGPRFESLAEDAADQLVALQHPQDAFCSLFTRPLLQDVAVLALLEDNLDHALRYMEDDIDHLMRHLACLVIETCRPDPLCCRANEHMPSANNNIISSKSPFNIPEPVIHVHCKTYISVAEYNYLSNTTELARDWPTLELHVDIKPHSLHHEDHQGSYEHTRGNNDEPRNASKRINACLREMQEMEVPNAIRCFIRQPSLVEYSLHSRAAHGNASFSLRTNSIQLQSLPMKYHLYSENRAPELIDVALDYLASKLYCKY